ncbi:MAG TPA: hypothetical protein VHB98_12340 [Chloroflexota bacterium]|nr:hypothetical protein [Chloroflexota bacterium]
MGMKQGSVTLEALATRLQELEQEIGALRPAPAADSTRPAMQPAPERDAGEAQTATSRRKMLRTVLGTAAATVAAGAAGLSLEGGTASANTGGNMILGEANLASSPTQVKWNGSSPYGGVILLGNDTSFSGTGAFFPAACGGFAGGGVAGVPHGVYGFTQALPTTSVTPAGVAGVSMQGTGVHGESRSTSISSIGVEGVSASGIGVSGSSTNGTGVSGTGGSSSPGTGVVGTGNTGVSGVGVTTGVAARATGVSGVGVTANGPSIGVSGTSTTTGVQGLAFGAGGVGVAGNSFGAGGHGVQGISSNGGDGVLGRSTNPSEPGNGVHATAAGVTPTAGAFGAVFAEGGSSSGVCATSTTGTSVRGISSSGIGVLGTTGSTASGGTAISGTVTSTTPGIGSAAIAGRNNGTNANGCGVAGSHAGSGIGVHGACVSGFGIFASSNSGAALGATSASGRGGIFTGGPAAIQLTPSTAATHPASGTAGDLFVDASHNLWFCKGGLVWVKLA